jgi:hypothetical protein
MATPINRRFTKIPPFPLIGSPVSSGTVSQIIAQTNTLVGFKALSRIPLSVSHPIKEWAKDDLIIFGADFVVDPETRQDFWAEYDDNIGFEPNADNPMDDYFSFMNRNVVRIIPSGHTEAIAVNIYLQQQYLNVNTVTLSLQIPSSGQYDLASALSVPPTNEIDRVTFTGIRGVEASDDLPSPIGSFAPASWISTGDGFGVGTIIRPLALGAFTAGQEFGIRIDHSSGVRILHVDVFEVFRRSI